VCGVSIPVFDITHAGEGAAGEVGDLFHECFFTESRRFVLADGDGVDASLVTLVNEAGGIEHELRGLGPMLLLQTGQ